MILMLIDFDDHGLLAFWGEVPQDCWTQFITEHADELEDLDDVDFTNLACAADFYDPTELSVTCKVERKITFS